MQNIILPVAYEFCPELVLVSAGFDAAVGDPLGGKNNAFCFDLILLILTSEQSFLTNILLNCINSLECNCLQLNAQSTILNTTILII